FNGGDSGSLWHNPRESLFPMRLVRVCAVIICCLSLAASGIAQKTGRNPARSAVGKLGQFKQRAPIYRRASKGARVLYYGTANLYVVLKDLSADWATLVMADGTEGYVEAKFIESLPY